MEMYIYKGKPDKDLGLSLGDPFGVGYSKTKGAFVVSCHKRFFISDTKIDKLTSNSYLYKPVGLFKQRMIFLTKNRARLSKMCQAVFDKLDTYDEFKLVNSSTEFGAYLLTKKRALFIGFQGQVFTFSLFIKDGQLRPQEIKMFKRVIKNLESNYTLKFSDLTDVCNPYQKVYTPYMTGDVVNHKLYSYIKSFG